MSESVTRTQSEPDLLRDCVPELVSGEPVTAKEFYERYKEWFDMQNELVERRGIPGEEYRPW